MLDGGNRYANGIAAPFFGNQVVVGQILFNSFDVWRRLIDLIDSNDDRNAGCLGMVNGFDCLRHDTVVSSHYEDRDIGRHSASCTHSRESFVAGRIEEGDIAVIDAHFIRTDVLGDTGRLLRQ